MHFERRLPGDTRFASAHAPAACQEKEKDGKGKKRKSTESDGGAAEKRQKDEKEASETLIRKSKSLCFATIKDIASGMLWTHHHEPELPGPWRL